MNRNWRALYGPLSLRMPVDPPCNLHDWSTPGIHEDPSDCLNADGTWGPPDPGEVGGSGISFGYSRSDINAVRVAAAACAKRKPVAGGVNGYDAEHAVRGFRYAGTLAEMDPTPANIRAFCSLPNTFPRGPVSYGQGWTPFTIDQYYDMALKNKGKFNLNLRAAGWAAWLQAWQWKFTRRPDREWEDMFVEIGVFAANEYSGQICLDTHEGINEDDVEYSFHKGIFIMGTLAVCARTGWGVPSWISLWMNNILELPVMDYGGCPSMPAFTCTRNSKLVAATGPAQAGDPAHGWWSSCCVAMFTMTHDHHWLDVATKYGPTGAGDEQSLKESMLLRGLLQ